MVKARRRKSKVDAVMAVLTDCRGPAHAVRIRDLARRQAVDPALGTPVGRMYVLHEITSAMYDAAVKLASLRAAADRVLGLPPRNAAALDYGASKGMSLYLDMADPENERAIVTAYDNAEAAIVSPQDLAAVQYVVIYEREPVGYEHRLALYRGLKSLAKHWGLG